MKILYNLLFYVLASMSILCAILCMFDRNILRATKFCLAGCFMIFGLILLLNAPVCAILQFIIFGISGILLVYLAKLTKLYKKLEKFNLDEKNGFLINFKTIVAPIIGFVFIFSAVPFMLLDFNKYKSLSGYNFQHTLPPVLNNIFLLGILTISVSIGIISILNIKNLYKKCKNLLKNS